MNNYKDDGVKYAADVYLRPKMKQKELNVLI